jgi:hypothetical protein
LVREGGVHKVPCLRIDHTGIETEWLYGSANIISYLQSELRLSE